MQKMNKTMAFLAVVLTVVTAFYLVGADVGSDGAVPNGYVEISDADSVSYTDSSLPGTKIYITSSTVKAEAFKDCTTITNVTLSDDVISVGSSAFEGCTKLTYFKSTNLRTVGNSCFKNTGAVNFNFSPTLTSIGIGAFEGCKGTGPYLLNTSVTQIKENAYLNSKVQIEDLRGVTSIVSGAFDGSTLIGQILSEGQTSLISDLPVITVKDVGLLDVTSTYNTATKKFLLTFYVSSADVAVNVTDASGTNAATVSSCPSGGSFTYLFDKTAVRIEGKTWTIHFPEISGLGDIVHKTGEGTFVIPLPSTASNLFKSWNLRGETATRSTILESEFITFDKDVYLEVTYNTFDVTFNHSALPDSSGLPTVQSFSIGDSYPTLPDTLGYEFSGWMVGNDFYSGGSKITVLRSHTAVSQWNADTFTVTLVSEGNTIGTRTVAANTELRLSELSVTVPESKRLLGWSLESNGAVLTSNPVIDRDRSIFAVFENKAQYTLRFLDGTTVLGTVSAYDGDSVTIQQNNPELEGKTFQNWVLGDTDTTYYKGDSIVLNGNIDLKASWLTVKTTLKYVLSDAVTESYDYGTTAVIGCESAVKDGFTLQGWATSPSGATTYHDGDRLVMTEDTKLYPVWSEIGKHTITVHDHDGKTSKTVVEHGASYTLPRDSGWERHTFQGWATSENGTVSFLAGDSLSVNDDIDFYEVWQIDPSQIPTDTTEQTPPSGQTEPVIDTPSESETTPVADPPADRTTPVVISEDNTDAAPRDQTPAIDSPAGQTTPTRQTSQDSTPAPSGTGQPTVDTTPTSYTLAFMDGTALIASLDLTPYTLQSLSDINAPSKDGYRFIGWSENRYAQNASLTAQSTKMIVRDTTLYAVWEKLMVVNYHDGSSVDTEYVEKGGQLNLKILLKEGYEFLGWSESGSDSVQSGRITVSKDMDLYPEWKILIVDSPASETQGTPEPEVLPAVIDVTEDSVTDIETPSSGGGTTIATVGIGAAIAAIVSSVVIFQLRRS